MGEGYNRMERKPKRSEKFTVTDGSKFIYALGTEVAVMGGT